MKPCRREKLMRQDSFWQVFACMIFEVCFIILMTKAFGLKSEMEEEVDLNKKPVEFEFPYVENIHHVYGHNHAECKEHGGEGFVPPNSNTFNFGIANPNQPHRQKSQNIVKEQGGFGSVPKATQKQGNWTRFQVVSFNHANDFVRKLNI